MSESRKQFFGSATYVSKRRESPLCHGWIRTEERVGIHKSELGQTSKWCHHLTTEIKRNYPVTFSFC
jgi:hypothetical protein